MVDFTVSIEGGILGEELAHDVVELAYVLTSLSRTWDAENEADDVAFHMTADDEKSVAKMLRHLLAAFRHDEVAND